MKQKYDVAIIGAGFSGSILAWILASRGRSVALVDSQKHPRFAIGESSTPIADMLLRRLGQRYGLLDLVHLSAYGSWKANRPELACGRKRGFSYYRHKAGEPFHEGECHENSLLVAASASDEVADTHWYRPAVDEFLFQRAIGSGAEDVTGFRVEVQVPRRESRLVLTEVGGTTQHELQADWVIDAAGRSSVLAQLAGARSGHEQLRTNTFSVFAHFDRIGSWRERLVQLGQGVGDDPFNTDDAAQHHLLDDGWLWMLRFDNGITSVGLTSSASQPTWDISRYPSLVALLSGSSVVAPGDRPVSSGRIQRLFDPVIDQRSLMMPTAAVTIDPLHSTGIAHALAGVDRVATIILGVDDRSRKELIESYRQAVLGEAQLLDRLVDTAYQTMGDFPRFVAACMLYFSGAICCEERYGNGEFPRQLWNADDASFVRVVHQACDRLLSDTGEDVTPMIRKAIEPWNTAGLLDPVLNNRYAYTATKR